MKNVFKILLILLLITINFSVFSQKKVLSNSFSEYNNNIGIQINPYVDLNHISDDYKQNIIALRYGYQFHEITLGTELFNWHFKNSADKGNTIGAGLYTQYHFVQSKNINLFIELCVYYSHTKSKIYDIQFPNGNIEIANNKFSYYVAPGIRINLYKNRLTLDLMVKLSTEYLLSGKHFDPSFKINFHF